MMFSPTKQSRSKTIKRNHSEFEQFSSGEINRMSVHEQQKRARKLAQDFVKSESNRSPSLTPQQPHGESIRFMDFLVQTTVDKHSKNSGVLAAAKKYSELPNTPTARANGLREFEIECQPHIEQELTVNAGFELANATSNICNQMALLRKDTEFGRFAQGLGAMTQAAQGVYQITQASALMSQATSGLSAMASGAMMLGAVGAVIAAGYMMYSLCSEEEDTGNGLGEALQAIHSAILEMHQEMRERFQHLEELIQENMGVVLTRLQEINAKLDRLERIMSISFKEVQMKPLVDAIYSIQRDFKYKHLTDEERNHLVEELGSWLENHVKSTIQTSVSRDSDDLATCVEIMSSPDFDSAAMFPYLVRQLAKNGVIPHHLIPGNLLTQPLSNLALLQTIADIYCLAIVRYEMTAPCRIAPMENILNSIQRAECFVSEMRESKIIWQMLLKQHHHYRYQVGLAIAKCRLEMPEATSMKEPFSSFLTVGRNEEELTIQLDRMEFIRWLLIRLQEVTGLTDQSICDAIKNLETKNQVLQTPKARYDAANAEFIDNVKDGRYLEIKENILNGANVNQIVPQWRKRNAQIIHCLLQDINRTNTQLTAYSQEILYLFLMCGKAFEAEKSTTGQWNNHGTYWHSGMTPIKLTYNGGNFHLMLLWIASGYEVTADSFYGSEYAYENVWKYIVQKYLIQTFNGAKREDLVRAYRFYRNFETGFAYTPDETIDLNCLLWLICVLGNTELLELLPASKLDVNQSIPHCNFTPLMMATYCGQEKVVDWLLNQGADVHVEFSTVDPHPEGSGRDFSLPESEKPHLYYLSIGENSGPWGLWGLAKNRYKIAQKFVDIGLIPTVAQEEILAKGLNALTIEASKSGSEEIVSVHPKVVHMPTIIDVIKKNLLETKGWFVDQQSKPIRDTLHHGMMLLSLNHQQFSNRLETIKSVIEQAQGLRLVSENNLIEVTNVLSHLETQFAHTIESATDFNDEIKADYNAPQNSATPTHPSLISEEKRLLLAQRWVKKTKSTIGFSLSETVVLLEGVIQSFRALPTTAVPAVLLVGRSQVGKSTLANALSGVLYQSARNQLGRRCVQKSEASTVEEFAPVGQGQSSKTLFPNMRLSQDGSCYWVDMPGYYENRGKPQQISTSIAFQCLQQHCQTMKGIVMVCDENEFLSNGFATLRTSLENVGRMLPAFSDDANQHVLLVVTHSRGEITREGVLAVLNMLLTTEYSDVIGADKRAVKRALLYLTQSIDGISFVDVTHPESVAELTQKINTLPVTRMNQFNLTPTSDLIELFKKLMQAITAAERELNSRIEQLQAVIKHQFKSQLQSTEITISPDLVACQEKLRVLLTHLNEEARNEPFEFTCLVEEQKDLAKRATILLGTLSQLLNTKADTTVIYQEKMSASEALIEKYAELEENQAFFNRMTEIAAILPDASGYETDDDVEALLEQDTRDYLIDEGMSLIEDEQETFGDETSEQSIWIKPDETAGLRILRPAYHAVGQLPGFFGFFNDKGYTVAQLDKDVSVRLNIKSSLK